MKAIFARVMIIGMGFLVGPIAFGQEAQWSLAGLSSYGNKLGCDESSTQFIENGNDASIILSDMASDMVAGDGKNDRSQFGVCRIFMKLKVPKGYMVSEMNTNILGGVEKSKQAYGYIDAQVSMFRRFFEHKGKVFGGIEWIDQWAHLQRIFKWGTQYSEPLLTLTETQKANRHSRIRQCQLTKNSPAEFGVELRLQVAAYRARADQSAIVAVDTIDSRVSLNTTIQPCK